MGDAVFATVAAGLQHATSLEVCVCERERERERERESGVDLVGNALAFKQPT
jgi:hypothetical protein